jgi:hypothetical protein
MKNQEVYEAPVIVFEGTLEIQAGSPIGLSDPFTDEL